MSEKRPDMSIIRLRNTCQTAKAMGGGVDDTEREFISDLVALIAWIDHLEGEAKALKPDPSKVN